MSVGDCVICQRLIDAIQTLKNPKNKTLAIGTLRRHCQKTRHMVCKYYITETSEEICNLKQDLLNPQSCLNCKMYEPDIGFYL